MSNRMAKRSRPIDPRRSASVFAALGDETRLRLLAKLGRGEAQSITQLAVNLPVTRQAVTKHLRILERAKLVTEEPQGRERRFVARPAGIDEVQAALRAISQQWDDALGRLKAFVENKPGDSE